MKRGEVWWADLPEPAGRRPVVLLSRDEAYMVRELVTIAPVTIRVRGIPVEIPLGKREGLRRSCVANLDMITAIPKRCLTDRISTLTVTKIQEVDDAIRFALAL